jgi:hypothetical protein
VLSALRKPVPRSCWEILAAGAVVGARAWALSGQGVWRDWIVLLALYWMLAAVGYRSRAWPYLSGTVMAGLLVLYGWGQIPFALAALRLRP